MQDLRITDICIKVVYLREQRTHLPGVCDWKRFCQEVREGHQHWHD